MAYVENVAYSMDAVEESSQYFEYEIMLPNTAMVIWDKSVST